MKILIVSSSDINGGAAKAANRLHIAFLKNNIQSIMLVQEKGSHDNNIIGPKSKFGKVLPFIKKALESLPLVLYKKRTKTLFHVSFVSFSNIKTIIKNVQPDFILIHWVNAGMLRIEDLRKIKQPIFIVLHDMWWFTGGCHYDEECGRYRNKCGSCPVLGSKMDIDLSSFVFNRKKRILSSLDNIKVVGLSTWISKCAQESTLFKNHTIYNIPNPIDINLFKPVNIDFSREALSLPKGKKLVLYGAMNAISDHRKGYDLLIEAVNRMKLKNVEFVVFGGSKPKNQEKINYKTHYLGSILNDQLLCLVYNAADVMVVPSRQENLSNSIMESLSCGTPVVSFNIGGNSNMIEHKNTGYVAKAYDTEDLAYGIEWILKNLNYKAICESARDKVVNEFGEENVVSKYIRIFNNELGKE
jgi:glycosyltransferase involved in cell wall biosynthesis